MPLGMAPGKPGRTCDNLTRQRYFQATAGIDASVPVFYCVVTVA